MPISPIQPFYHCYHIFYYYICSGYGVASGAHLSPYCGILARFVTSVVLLVINFVFPFLCVSGGAHWQCCDIFTLKLTFSFSMSVANCALILHRHCKSSPRSRPSALHLLLHILETTWTHFEDILWKKTYHVFHISS